MENPPKAHDGPAIAVPVNPLPATVRMLPLILLYSALLPWVTEMPAYAQAVAADSVNWRTEDQMSFTLYYMPADSAWVQLVDRDVLMGQFAIRDFFGRGIRQRFRVYLFPERRMLDLEWKEAWGDSSFKSQCWMVASGVASRLDLLSPRVWSSQTCEHNAEDSVEIQRLITHELVHIFHAQFNPRPGLEGLDSLAWFIEGLAVYSSGQLDAQRMKDVQSTIAAGAEPKHLGEFWSGKSRYGNAGSLVRFIDRKYGRDALLALMAMDDERDMLRYLGTAEDSLISRWKQSP